MSIATTRDLFALLRSHRLLDTDRLAEVEGPLAHQYPDPRNLARELVRRGWLTGYQVNQLFQGNGHGLNLGPYILLDRLGEGGMGAVFKARHAKLGRIVALKLIRKERLESAVAVKRFQRECMAAARLDHPNVVRAFDADEDGGTHFFAMEYVDGVDLARLVKEKGPLPVAEACDCVRQAALGLQHAFEKGMVHRDIKPHNLLRTPDGVVKILDMGLARFTLAADDSDSRSSLTQDGALIGTPDYIAPEQARDSRSADIRADLYSLGCTLFYLLTGRVPFGGSTLTAKLLSHQMDAIPDVCQLRPDVPKAVGWVVARLMAKDPADRYPTPADAAAALDAALRDRSAIRAAAPPSPVRRGPTSATDPFAEIERSPSLATPRAQPRRWLIPAIVAGMLLIAGVVLAVWLLSRGPPADPSADNSTSAGITAEPPPKNVSAEQIDAARKFGVRVQIENSVGMKLNLIPPGKFLMGSPETEPGRQPNEGPRHLVTLTKPFYLGVYEVTQRDFQRVMGRNPSQFHAANRGGPSHPVENVSWQDTVAFCHTLSEFPAEKTAGRVYRLPTEAEWEYACRAGTESAYSFGDDLARLPQFGWATADFNAYVSHPVGGLKPNAWGLFDMHGNVQEWCADYDHAYPAKAETDPQGPRQGQRRILRGGPWVGSGDIRCRSAFRAVVPETDHYFNVGFRVVCEVPAKP